MCYAFTLIVYGFGFLNVGVIIFIILYFVPLKRTGLRDIMRWYTILISFSYMMLELASMIACSIYRLALLDVWVLVAEIVGFISLLLVFRTSVMRRKKEDYDQKKYH